MTRIERWFKRHDLTDTHRLMKIWNTNSYREFFHGIFHSPLTEIELSYILNYEEKVKTKRKFNEMMDEYCI